jgi:hypothetical protein
MEIDMAATTELGCACGAVRMVVEGAPLISSECYCTSCRDAAGRMAGLPGAARVDNAAGGTHFVLYRKDRVRIVAGRDRLRAFRLKPESPTRRVVASCCNTPVFLEFKGGHWMSLYAGLWPRGMAPAAEIRTMTRDLPAGTVLDDTLPAGAWTTAGFYARLFAAWAAMGFRSPEVAVPGEEMRI